MIERRMKGWECVNRMGGNLLMVGCTAILLAAPLAAQQEGIRPTIDDGAGFTTPIGGAGHSLDTGWNVGVGGGLNFSNYFGMKIDVGYTSFGINGATLANVGFPGGNVNIFSATLDPVIHVGAYRKADFYIIGGAGEYRVEQQFTEPTVANAVGFSPFFGFYNTSFLTNQVVSESSVNKLGWNGGAGVAFGTKWRGKIFAEARFNRIYMGGVRRIDYSPVAFGFRW